MLKRTDQETIAYPILDGWMFRRDNRCDMKFQSLAIDQYEALRRATGLRQKQWAIPTDVASFPIPAFDSYEYQLDVGIGAVIWGWSFVGPTEQAIDNGFATIAWQVRDACDDQPFFEECITRELVLSGSGGQAPFTSQNLLARPWVVGKPGLLNVTISSMYSTPQQAQLILYGGRPARASA